MEDNFDRSDPNKPTLPQFGAVSQVTDFVNRGRARGLSLPCAALLLFNSNFESGASLSESSANNPDCLQNGENVLHSPDSVPRLMASSVNPSSNAPGINLKRKSYKVNRYMVILVLNSLTSHEPLESRNWIGKEQGPNGELCNNIITRKEDGAGLLWPLQCCVTH